jgi:hypothetical protein
MDIYIFLWNVGIIHISIALIIPKEKKNDKIKKYEGKHRFNISQSKIRKITPLKSPFEINIRSKIMVRIHCHSWSMTVRCHTI